MRSACLALSAILLGGLCAPALAAESAAPYVVLSGRDSAVEKPECLRIRTADEWAAVWKRHAPTGHPPAVGPNVDFERCMVIAVFLGATVNTYGIRVVETVERDVKRTTKVVGPANIELFEKTEEGKGELAIGLDRLSYQSTGGGDAATPYAFLILPRTDKAVVLRFDTRDLRQRSDNVAPIWKQRHRFPAVKPGK